MSAPAPSAYAPIVRHYEACLRAHGATAKGVDWPDEADLGVRFDVMLDGWPTAQSNGAERRLLDLGCGPGLLVDHLDRTGRAGLYRYTGIDVSTAMIRAARERWPGRRFEHRDILADPVPPESFDWGIMNGVLTVRRGVPQATMAEFARHLIAAAFAACRVGIAVNVMSPHVDWTRPDLFHWPIDDAVGFATDKLTRHVALRGDYGLYEYTLFLYRTPNRD
ncbi:MAG: class I SAM-dependent methyltransferase [Alphaproteobacteria bacterium]